MTLEATAPEAEPQEVPPAAEPETPAPAEPVAPAEEPAAPTAEAEGDEAEEGEDDKPEDKARRRKGGFQRTIERLERERENDREMFQREREMLLERLTAQPVAKPPAKDMAPEDQAAEYIDSLVEKRLAAREAQRQQQSAQAEFQRRTLEVRAAHPDFDEVVQSARHVRVSPAVQEALFTSEHGPALMYQLASNPLELARIGALPALEAAREIGRLEAKVSVAAAPQKPAAPAARPKSAPAPLTPVTARGASSVKRPEDMTYEEYNAWRDGQRKR